MKASRILGIFFFIGIGTLTAVLLYAHGHTLPVLQPSGSIGQNERSLIFHTVELMLIVIVPVLFLLFFFAWYYRADNTKATYSPDWEHSKMDELVWWAIPFEIVLVLGALTWTSTHELDPHKALAGDPVVIQAVALDWKWLFIYPDEHIATVNFIEIPVGRPVAFQITADAPMNSFWIPQLGGQIMAMTGMVNPLSLVANAPGDYRGGSANYSGEGFAQMQFTTRAVSQNEYDAWVAGVRQSQKQLDMGAYKTLAEPGTTDTPVVYGFVTADLYNQIVMQFMDPAMPGMNMTGMDMSNHTP